MLLLILSGVMFTTCKKEKIASEVIPEIINLVFDRGAVSTINKEKREVLVTIPDYVDKKSLVGIFQLSSGSKAYVNGVLQKSSETANDFTKPIKYIVTNESNKTSEWAVRFQSNNFRIGLGSNVEYENRLPIDHSMYYYVTQDIAGVNRTGNGGAACIAMALRWASPDNVGVTATDIKKGIMSTTELFDILKREQIPLKIVQVSILPDYSEITECIDKGLMVILCVDFAHIPYNAVSFVRIHRFWDLQTFGFQNTATHFIVIKGYKKVDGKLYYESYDPFSQNQRYSDNGEPKGYNRYYLAENIRQACFRQGGWEYAVVAGQKRKMIPLLKNELTVKQIDLLLDIDNYYGYRIGF
jgi:hypothetical protein